MLGFATLIYLFFAAYLFSQTPSLNLRKIEPLLQVQPVVHQRLAQTTIVTTTQAVSMTGPMLKEPKPLEFYRRVAARSLGEGSSALAEIACTIKNRVRVSRNSLTVVLRAYYARDRRPGPEHIEIVRKVFEGELPCPTTWWYALSLQDTRRFRPHPHPAAVIKRDPRGQVWIYDR